MSQTKDGIITVVSAVRGKPRFKGDKGPVLHWTVAKIGGKKINKKFKTQADAREFARAMETADARK